MNDDGSNPELDQTKGATSPAAVATMALDDSGTAPAASDQFGVDPLLSLLEIWEAQHRQGSDPAPESLCARNPALLDELRERIARQKKLYAMLEVPGSPSPEVDADAAEPRPLPTFPGHVTLCVIGQGGMGIVYKARQTKLGRFVAIKTMAESRQPTREQLERFLNEANAVARLNHPNIISIHAIGEHEARPYLSLEFAEGGNLAQRLAEKPMATLEAAALVETLARAVQAAHQAGVVHRDIKPGNILLTADGVCKISDFGLAKLLDADSTLTGTGQPLGTPSYMAPEQAKGQSKQVGPAADIYGLGAILYHALVGRPPFVGGSPIETLNQVVHSEVVPPRRLRPETPRDLETICLKCLDKEPNRRYAAAADLADDLHWFQEGRPIAARPIGPAGRSWRWAKRKPWLAGLSAALLLTFIAGTPTLLGLWLRARADRASARSEAAISKAVNEFLNKDLLAKASPENQSGPGSRPDPDIKLRDVLDLAAGTIGSRFAAQPLVEASVQKTIGETYEQLGLYQKALPHLERALELHRREQGPGHPETLASMAGVGSVKLADGKLDEAERLIVPAMDGLLRQRGPDHPDTLPVVRGAANLYYLQGKLAKAEHLFTQLRETYQRKKGPYDPETLDVVNDLACVYNEQGIEAAGAGKRSEAEAKYGEAEQLLLVIVNAFEQRMGREHPATLVAKGNLADSYLRQGRLAEAMKLRKEVLAAQRRVLGNQHPNTLYTMVALAQMERDQHSLREAASHLEEAVKGCRSALDRNHETADAALAVLADVYMRQGEIEKMGPVLTEAREITLFRWGPDQDVTCGANQAVAAYWQFRRNDHAKAESYLRDSLGYLVNHPERADRFKTESRLGLSLLMQKKYPEAKQHLLSAYSGARARKNTSPPGQNADLANIVQWTAQLYHESAAGRDDKDYDLIRSDPVFQAIVLDLGFPADPFATGKLWPRPFVRDK